jgi:hypothetical protein
MKYAEKSYRHQIHTAGYYGIYRRINRRHTKFHLAHWNRGRGVRLYICGCLGMIRTTNYGCIYPKGPSFGSKQSHFQFRSKYNLRFNK